MRKTLFAKFSRERSRMFQISTVLEIKDGEKRAVKTALHDKAVAHVLALAENEKKLKELYKDPRLEVCPCYQEGEKSVVFPYVSGRNFEERLSKHILEQSEEKVTEDIRLFYQLLTSVTPLVPFEKTNAFQHLFGDVDLPKELMAAPISNLDMVLGNLIEKEDGNFVLVDYEWIFDFPIPLSFIFTRSLLLHGQFQTLSEKQQEVLYAIGGVDIKDVPLYLEMEKKFQQYVAGAEELHVLGKLYPNLNTRNFRLVFWDTRQVYYRVRVSAQEKETGKEKDLLNKNYYLGDVKEQVEIGDTNSIDRLIIRPVDGACVIKIRSITDQNGQDLSFTHNADHVSNDDYFFKQQPELYLDPSGITQLNIDYMIWHRNEIAITPMIDLRIRNAELQAEVERYSGQFYNRVRRKVGSLIEKK